MKGLGPGLLLGGWAGMVILAGGILSSYHVPFRTPGESISQLAHSPARGRWHAIHVLSGSCGCSQRVMQHLLARRPMDGVVEEIVIVDGQEPYLPGSAELLTRLAKQGFAVNHIEAASLPPAAGLRGVPLLVLAGPEGSVRYSGGYGGNGDQDAVLLREIEAGHEIKPLAVVGCAVGSRLRRSADPFHLKY